MNRLVTKAIPVTELTVAEGNYDTSRAVVDRLVLHTMVGTIESANQRFNDPTQKVSAHYGVGMQGNLVHWVDEENTAYHAGNYAMNQRSLSIEHEDNGDYNGVRPDTLYTTSAKLVRDICQFYNIPIDRTHILKHSEVIATGCPDALDIDRIVREAQGVVPSSTSVAVDSQTFTELVTKSTNYDNFVKGGFSSIQDVTNKIQQLEGELAQANQNASDLADKLKQITTDDSELGNRNVELGHELDAATSTIQSLYNDLGVKDFITAENTIKQLKNVNPGVVARVASWQGVFEDIKTLLGW